MNGPIPPLTALKDALYFTVSGAGFDSPQTFTSDCGGSGTYTFNFTTAWNACDEVSFTARLVDCDGNDVPNTGDLSGTYALVGVCDACPHSTLKAEVTCRDDENAISP